MRRLFSIFAGVFLVTLAISVQTASAQEDVGRLLKQLEEDSDRFSNTVAKALDNSVHDGTAAEDEMIRYARDFEDSIDRVKKAYDQRQDTKILVKAVETRAKTIDKFLKKNKLGGNVATDWGTVRSVLLRLKTTKIVKA